MLPFVVRFMAGALYAAWLSSALVPWGRAQMEGQIDKMQQAVFNSPGAEAPVPPQVFLAAGGFLVSQLLVGRLLGLSRWQTLLGGLAGTYVGFLRANRRTAI